ncbi:biotin/lipoate A/B protein ligase family protein [Ornithinibacillus sp. 4-3]|uniref:Biotin/lipoate A/B protein ligase family protein n=1 Tax=Ornithinibacillus sp. 4-3 TaxID=3231488 RepID=A0AB39HPR6_9BACI
MEEIWGLLHTGHQDAAINMALDEALIKWHSNGDIPPVLRFYGWSKPTLSVGRFQKVEKSINFATIEQNDCQFVRRLTGGSAVLHDDELTYSIVVSEDKPYIAESVLEAYYTLSKGIMAGFKILNIPVESFLHEERKKKERTEVCFERASDYEMLVDGKKLSGHAQTRVQGVLMQHGSLPFTMDTELLFNLFNYPSDRVRDRQRKGFYEKAITMNEASENNITYEQAAKAFEEGFKQALNLKFEDLELTAEQWKEVEALAENKYRSKEWNMNRNRKKVQS